MNGRTADQHDAYSVAAWLRQADLDGQLARLLNPDVSEWIAGRVKIARDGSRQTA